MELTTKFHKLSRELVKDHEAEALCDRLRAAKCPVRDYDDAHYRLFLLMNELHREMCAFDYGNQSKWFRAFPGLLKMMRIFSQDTGLFDFPEKNGYPKTDDISEEG